MIKEFKGAKVDKHKVMLLEVPTIWENLFKKTAPRDSSSTPLFNITILLDKTKDADKIEAIKLAINYSLHAAGVKYLADIDNPLRDGDKPNSEGVIAPYLVGKYKIQAKSNNSDTSVQVIDGRKNHITEANNPFKSGSLVNIVLRFVYALKTKKMMCKIGAVQYIRDGEYIPVGERIDAQAEFDVIDTEQQVSDEEIANSFGF